MEQKVRELIVAVSHTSFDDGLPFPMHLRILQTVYRRLTHDFTHRFATKGSFRVRVGLGARVRLCAAPGGVVFPFLLERMPAAASTLADGIFPSPLACARACGFPSGFPSGFPQDPPLRRPLGNHRVPGANSRELRRLFSLFVGVPPRPLFPASLWRCPLIPCLLSGSLSARSPHAAQQTGPP